MNNRIDPQGAHRRDIDGLRAVAILGVLGYHASSGGLRGGFVGVDIFFVLSGYLISRIIFGGLRHSSFSFVDFYARRIKRIFPALLVVLAAVSLFGWFALLTDEYEMLGKHVAAGAAFVANFVLWRETGYFDPAADLKPLLHLWSLGIEEQFYLFWPLLLCLLAWRRIKPLPVVIAITIVSFALNVAWVGAHEARAFYSPITRLWELSLGGALSCVEVTGSEGYQRWSAWVDRGGGRWLSVLGLSLLLLSLVLLSNTQLFPGWRAALPTVGTLLLIAAGPKPFINRAMLGHPIMVFVGLISYPLYLWHWPLLSFQRVLAGGEISGGTVIVTMALAVLLAWLTWRFIERPIRSSRLRLQPSLTLLSGVTLAGIVGYLSFVQVLEPRSARFGLDKIVSASSLLAFPGPNLRVLSKNDSSNIEPVREQGKGNHAVLFLGDSFVEQYYPRIDWLLSNYPLQTRHVIFSTCGGCPPLPHVREKHHPYCDGLIERGIALAHSPEVDTVVVAADWISYFIGPPVPEKNEYYYDDGTAHGDIEHEFGTPASERTFAALEAMIRDFVEAGRRVYLVLPHPTGIEFQPRSLIQRGLTDLSFRITVPNIATSTIVAQMQPVVDRLRQIAARTGAEIIDPVPSLCHDGTCSVVTAAGEPLYRDFAHLNPEFVRQSVGYLDGLLMLQGPRVAAEPLRSVATSE